MDFSISEKMKEVLQQIRTFIDSEIIPLEQDFLHRPFTDLLPELREKQRRVQELGFWLPALPKEAGGMGLSLTEHALVMQELGRSPMGVHAFHCQAPDAGNMEILHQFGTAAQKQQFLEPLLAGEIRSCFSMTEPGYPGSNPVWMGTKAVRDGDDYVINGRKWFTSAADGAAFAIVMAVTDPEGDRHRRASMILVPLDTPGFEIVRRVQVMGHAGEDWNTHPEVVYKDVRVPRDNLLGEENEGFAIAQARLGPGRIQHCMRWIGVCERSFDLMCRRAETREIAPGELLATKQTIQTWIAESRARIDAARLMVLRAAWQIEQHGSKSAATEISQIKFFVPEVMMEVIDRAIQVHGALGMTDDVILGWFYRHERASRIADGPDEVHKSFVARRIFKERGIKIPR